MSLVVRTSPALLSLVSASFVATLVVACAADSGDDPASTGGGTGTTNQAGSTATTTGGSAATTAGTSGTVIPPGGSSSTGGTGATAGGTGTAGGAPATGCTATDPMLLISDFETGKADVAMVGGRDGSWFLFNDGTGTQLPMKIVNTPLAAEAGGACASAFAFHTTGQNFTVWGFGLGTDLAPKTAMVRTPYNLSTYKGLALRAKADKPASLRMSISDPNTVPPPDGMQCTDTTDKTNPARCGDYFGKEFSLTTDWQDLQMPWTEMTQRGWGLPIAAGFDAAHALTFRLQVKGTAAAPANYELWIDDVRLLQ